MKGREHPGSFALIVALGLVTGAGCSLALDFDSELDLPCAPGGVCKPEYVCLQTSNVCVAKSSVDDFKSCTFDAVVPDDLCKAGSTCIDFNGSGPTCLPRCVPQQFITPEASNDVRAQCAVGKYCWPIPGGGESQGVCYQGECTELANDCTAPQRCVNVNGAGVCFTPCKLFSPDQPCLGGQACHPLGNTNVTACIRPGVGKVGDVCTAQTPCAALTDETTPRPMVCDRPAVTGAADLRRCYKVCQVPSTAGCNNGERCVLARADVDPDRNGIDLGICQ